jgi:hypothetical protein
MSGMKIKKNKMEKFFLTLISKFLGKKFVEKKGGVWRPPPKQTFFSSKLADSNALNRKSLSGAVPKIQGGSQTFLRINCAVAMVTKNPKKILKNSRDLEIFESRVW